MGNLIAVHYTNCLNLTLSYDAFNRLTNLGDAVGTSKFTYARKIPSWSSGTASATYNTPGYAAGRG